MRKPLVAGNWKMNGLQDTNHHLLELLKKEGIEEIGEVVEIVVCPPFIYLADIKHLLEGSNIKWGAQNVSHHSAGAYTGEVSPYMLADLECHFAIVGHSERRTLYGETNGIVAKKFVAVQQANLTPILCVGESLREREEGITERVVKEQLDDVFLHTDIHAFNKAVIAYEPIWAIGTGHTATPDQAQEVHSFIRNYLSEQSPEIAQELRILYGGSVKGDNAAELFTMPDIDGGLVGGASLEAKDFLTICQAAS
ncbi:triose-phosphate isomerase [Candidatus Nitrosacidococcus sp. I8]|uniref:triose-phosphate isomerase n=1 Tax=Candidatus Nitrosacidococcus sp. I8 TaxID=2942908 RepID=UPI002227C5C0|nr:triose-phosphate isomerase [Candidatus Nitrosacidococcus sp. I8]CAH9016418.1 Triosephosphate isomerase [Candidatus Nitrosacidococcus sp. I8]